jgi:hypothetical protein
VHDSDVEVDIEQYHPALQSALRESRIISDVFEESDGRARWHRNVYTWSANFAVTLGAVAVLISICMITLPREWHDTFPTLHQWFLYAEVTAAGLALGVVVLGVVTDVKIAWLRERNKAERFRLLKFRFLIDPSRWTVAGGNIDTLSADRDDISNECPDFRSWVKAEQAPIFSITAVPDDALLADLLRYYCCYRLDHQIKFLGARAAEYEQSRFWLRPLPALLFYASFLFVAIHAVADLVGDHSTKAHYLSQTSLAVAVALPVLAAAARTLLLSQEFVRNSSRYSSKLHALTRLRADITSTLSNLEQGTRDSDDSVNTLRNLTCCEYLFESDHREWMRLMLEAEWF